jgi:hypothetical protein
MHRMKKVALIAVYSGTKLVTYVADTKRNIFTRNNGQAKEMKTTPVA